MIVFVAAAIGIAAGIAAARRRKGNRLDMAQYAAGYGIAFALLGLLATILIERLVA